MGDELAARFACDGFLEFTSDLPAEFHRAVVYRLTEATRDGRRDVLGNNLFAALPELQQLLESPPVRSALTTVVGADYILHPHRAVHLNHPDAADDPWHQETRGGHDLLGRSHHPWSAALFYYPQATTPDMGPTALLPGSQVRDQLSATADADAVSATCAAGGLFLIHYDLWHRRQPTTDSAPPRYLVKLQMLRASRACRREAGLSSHAQERIARQPPTGPGLTVATRHAEWLVGAARADGPCETADPVTADQLADPLESAHRCAQTADGRSRLYDVLRQGPDGAARHAGYALIDRPEGAVESLRAGPLPEHAATRQLVAMILAEHGGSEASAMLAELAADPSAAVRAAAVEALGSVDEPVLDSIVRAARDECYDVALQAAIAFCRLGPAAAPALPTLEELARSGDRYLEALALEAMVRTDLPSALRSTSRALLRSRWCSHTTVTSPW